MQSDIMDSVARMRDQQLQEPSPALGAPASSVEPGGATGGRHKELVAGLRLGVQATGQQASATRTAPSGAAAQGASQCVAPKTGVVPQTFTAPAASAQRTMPSSVIVPSRSTSQQTPLTPSTTSTSRTFATGNATSQPASTASLNGGSTGATNTMAAASRKGVPTSAATPSVPARESVLATVGLKPGSSGPAASGAPGGGTRPASGGSAAAAGSSQAAQAGPNARHGVGATFASAADNPVYDIQDIGMSPLALSRREAYMPASMAATGLSQSQQQPAQHHYAGPPVSGVRYAGPGAAAAGSGNSYGQPTPAVSQPGDLFNPNAVATAMARRPTELQYLCEMPSWTYQRPSLSGLDLITAAGSASASAPSNLAVPNPADVTPQELMVSERAVLSDLLHAFLGLATQLISPRLVPPAGAAASSAAGPCLTFMVREDLVHETLRERVAPLLPICDYVAALQRFVTTRSAHCYGTVTHALAAALRSYLEDWQIMVAMMENQMLRGALDLTRLTFYCQQPAAALAILADVAAQAANVERTSAGLLNLLHSRYSACAGNGPGRSLLHHLLTAAAAPYCACLERWLRQGVLDDPYHEFMVQEDQALRCDSPAATSGAHDAVSRASSYWRGRYTLRMLHAASRAVSAVATAAPAGAGDGGAASPGRTAASAGSGSAPAMLDVPIFMQLYKDLILRTGKYQNVLRECGQPVAQPVVVQSAAAAASGAPSAPLPPLAYDPTQPGNLQQHIRSAHAAASSALLGFLLRGSGGGGGRGGGAGLIAVLRSIKHFFLLDQGDVLVSIMEVADEELSKPAKAINRTRLQSLLEMAVKMSSAAADPHADSLSFEMDPRSLEKLSEAAAAVAALSSSSTSGADSSRVLSLSGGIDSPYGTPPQLGGSSAPAGRATLPMQRTPGGSRLLGPRDQDLPGWELFLPTLKLDWPATLVVGAEELLQYQLLFKHLWGLKRAERQLEATWLLLQGTKRLARTDKALSPHAAARRRKQMAVAHALCHQLHFTIQELLRYGTLDVLEPLWNCLEEDVQHRAADVDQVIETHRGFLRRAAAGLMLDQPRALRRMLTLQQSAAGFARHVATLWNRLQAGVETSSNATQVTPADMAAEQQRAAQLAAALDDLQRLMGETSAQIQDLVKAVRDHYESLMTGATAGSGGGGGAAVGALGGGGSGPAGGLAVEVESGGWDLEALQNLAERLDFGRPASGTLGAVLAALVGRQ